ncbi:MAG: TonB-dependent receptor [Flavobacteriaceae bacterium]
MKYYLLFIVLLTSSNILAQDCNFIFKGEIQDFHNKMPIEAATVYIENLNKYAISDINGKFIITNLCEGKLKVSVSHLSCETKILEINLINNIEQTIYLEHHVEELGIVTVEGKSINNKTSSGQETIIKSTTIDNFSSESLGDVLNQVSGVTSITTGSKIVKPVIGGLHSSRITIINNNVRMEDQEWGIEHAPNIDVNVADNISVIKGSGTLAYSGDAIGGIVVLQPKRIIKKDTLFGKTIAGFQSNGIGYNISSSLFKNFESGWFANGVFGYKQNGDLKSPSYYLNNTGAKIFSASLQSGFTSFEKGFEVYLSYIDNQLGILSSSHIGNTEDLVNAINNEEPYISEDFSYSIIAPRQEASHFLAKTNMFKRFKSFGKVSLQYDYQNSHRFEFDKRVGDDRDKAAVDLKLQTHSLKADVNVDKFDEIKLDFGLSGRFQDNFANPDTGVRRLIPDYKKYDFGIYAIVKKEFNEKLTADFGVRYDLNHIDALKFYRTSRWEERGYDEDFSDIIVEDLGTQLLTNPKLTFHNISVSTGLLYDVDRENSILFNYGLSSRPPNPSEIFSDGLHHSAARIELGDLRIDKEISNRFGFTYKFNNENLSLNLETHYNLINNFIYLQPTGTESTIRGSFPVWEYFQTNANLFGVDATASYKFLNNWNINLNSSYVYGQDSDNDRPIIDMPSFRNTSKLSYSKKEWNNLILSLEHIFVGKQNRYPDNNFDTYIASTDSFVTVDISTPPAAYNLFNFSTETTFSFADKIKLNVMAGINNIFNTKYREYLNRLRYFADDIGRNITLQLKLNY